MAFLPTDFSSFAWGALVGAAAAFAAQSRLTRIS